MVVPSPLAWQPIPARRRSIWNWLMVVASLALVTFIVLHLVTVSDIAYVPGSVFPANGPEGATTLAGKKAGSGDIYLVTVAEQSRVTEWDRLTASWLHKDWTLYPRSAVTGSLSTSQYNQANATAMSDSQEYAKVVALRLLGYAVPEHGDGVLVADVAPGRPADGVMVPGDVITAVDGKSVEIETDVGTAIAAHTGSSPVEFTVKRTTGKTVHTLTLDAKPVACGATSCPDDPTRPVVGISVTTDNQSFDLPKNVSLSIQTQGIGGPSAGLAFTLGALDALTSSRLTGGAKVAATGEIDASGNVLDIGGIVQKTITVERAGARYFLVPRGELAQAEKTAKGHDLTVVPVDTVDQALTFLKSIGGDVSGIPAAPTAV